MTAGLKEQRALTARRWLFICPLLALIVLDLGLIAFRVLLYQPLFSQPGAWIFLLEPALLLFVYAGIVLAIAATGFIPVQLQALHVGTIIGLITGVMWVVNLAIETFTNLSGLTGILSTAPFLLGAFVLWGIGAGRIGWRCGAVGNGVLAAVWSAMTCGLITIAFGLILTVTSIQRLEQQLAADPDYLRSGWSNIQAFAIANSLDAAFSHLLGALIFALIVGTLGGLVGSSLGGRNGPSRHTRQP
jgi:hypothetical protein